METLRDFVAELLESQGAAIETLEPDGLEVLAPAMLRNAMGWPELARLGFSAELPDQAMRIGLEGDWLDRFGGLLGENGRWAERQATLADTPTLGNPERLLDHAIELPNAVCRFHRVEATWTRCLILTFRYIALSDEKREGLVWLGFNLGTGAVLDEVLTRLRAALAEDDEWRLPEPEVPLAAGSAWDSALLALRLRSLLDDRLRRELEPFLRAMHRRLDRDRTRIHAYHDDLRSASLKRLAALAGRDGEKADADRRRESLRVTTIEREYRAKLDDLRHNYALRVSAEWVQALELFVPVQRLEVMIRRRKGERLIQFDWHPSARLAEAPPCDWGLGLGRVRLVCDEKLHLTEPAGQAPCVACGKAWCRACHPASCPRCGRSMAHGGESEPG
jgi:hypothetical protein